MKQLFHSLLQILLLAAVMLGVILIVPAKRWLREKREETVVQEEPVPEETPEETEAAEEEPVSDELKYVYREMLDEEQKTVYQDAYEAALEARRSFTPSVLLPSEEIKPVLEALNSDHAELFWLDISFSYMYDDEGLCHEIMLDYTEEADDLDASKENFQNSTEEIISAAKELSSDYDKEVYVHDALLDLIEYDEEAGNDQSAYGAVVNGRAVCAGYAKAFQYIMDELNIPVYYVTGRAEDTDHAWNIILLDGKYYNVDLTWDDQTPDRYFCFNRSDEVFSADHERGGMSENLPACTDE